MNEDEEYDSDNSDSTVLLADFVDNPKKIDVKRRRLSNLHDRGNQTNEFDDENTAPGDVTVNRRTGNSPEKKRNNVDKNWHITKYFACINKNKDTNIKNNDPKFLQNLDVNGKRVRSDIKINQGKISKENSTNIDSDVIICLDSDDETQVDDDSRDQDIKCVEISATSDRINHQNLIHKPARLTTRRATTDISEQNYTPQTEENKYPKLRVLKPHTINTRRASTHFEENNFTSNVVGKTTSIPKRTYTENEKETESNGYSTPRFTVAQGADVHISSNADSNNIVSRTTAVHNNTRTSTLATSIQPLKMDIDQNNGSINKGPRQDTNVFLNVNTYKRCASNNEMKTEPKRIKVNAKSIEPAEFNKNTPSNDLKSTALKESGRLESSDLYVDVQNEMHIMSAEYKAIHDGVGNERSNGQNASESINTTGAINEKIASVNTIDAKTKSTVMSNKTTPNKATKIGALAGLLHKVEASKICLNLTAHKNKAANYRNEKSDGNVVNENSMPIAKTFNNVCQNRGTSEAVIIQETHESRDIKETTKVQDLINKLQNKQMPTKGIDNQETSKVQAALDGSEALDEFGTSIERETSQVHDKQETNKVQDDHATRKPSDVVHDKHKVSKVQSGCTVPNQARHEQEAGKILDKGNSSDKQELNKAQDDQVTTEANEPEKNRVQDSHETCKRQTSYNADIRKKQTETVTSNTLNEKKPSQILDMTIVGETNEQEKGKVNGQLQTNNLQDEQIPNETLDKQVQALEETSEAEIVQVEITGRENNVMEIQHRQKVNNANKTIGYTNVQETVRKNEATSKASRHADEDNVFLLKIHVDFFTEVKKYLKEKDIFPESAMELHNIIETLRYRIVDARNGQVQTDVKYGCPNCSRVSNYSTRILNIVENEENKTNADGSQTCGFCNGIRKLHISYLKRFLVKKYSVNEKKEDVKMVSVGIDHPRSVEKSRNGSVGDIVIGTSRTTAEAKTDNNLAPASAGENSSCSSIIKNDKHVGNHALDRKDRKENNQVAQERPVPTINIPQLDICSTIDNNVNKAGIDITTPTVVSETDTVKVSDQDTPVSKDNFDNLDEATSSKTDLELKRKSDITYKEATDPKLIKTDTEETNRQRVVNLTEVSQTNERRNKIQIISDKYVMSSRTARLNSSLQSDAEVNSAANSETCNDVMMNTPEKSSYESTKDFQTNTIHQNTHDACLNPKLYSDNIISAEAEELNKRGKHFSEDGNQTIKSKSNENFNKERQSDVDQNGKEKATYTTSTRSILETNEANVNQVSNIEENYQGNGDVLKPLLDCFAKIKTSVKEIEDTLMKDQEGNKTPPESTSRIRPTIRGNRSNSLDNLQNRDNKKVVIKYACHSIKNSTTDDTTRQHKNQRRSEYKYLHLIRRIKIADVNNDKQNETPGDKNEELRPVESDTQHTNIGNESDSAAAASTGEITSIINNTLPHVNHTEWCCDESDKSAERPAAIHNEKERTPTDCNDLNLDANEERHVRSLRKDHKHDTNETCYVENNYRKIDETEPGQSLAKERINKQMVDEEHSSRRVSNDECNESETGNSHGIDNGISITSANETLTAPCTAENGKQGNNDLSTRYINNGEQSTEDKVVESTQINSNNNEKKETDSEDYCIKASDYTVKKRIERINKLFGDENEALVSSKIKASSELFACQKECQTRKDRTKKTERRRRNRKADVVHKRRKVTVEQCTESAESSDTSDSDWIISNDQRSDSSDSYDEFCTVKKQQVIRKLFSSEKKSCLQNGTTEESSSESGENNDDEEDEEEQTIKSTRYTVKKKNERLSKLFGDDNELSVSNEISEEDDRQARSGKKGHRSDRQCVEIEEGNKESAQNNNEQEVPSDDETLKVSEQTIKKKKTRISNYFGDDDEALVQVHDSNQQMESSDMNNAGCLKPTADDSRTTDVNVCLEDTQCRVEIPEMREHRINDKICVNEINHQETSTKKSGVDKATDRNGIIAVAEEENMNAAAVKNAESKSRDDDRMEINMIDCLLKEFASRAHQNGACAGQENDNEDDRNAEISAERQATSQSAKVKNCLDHIRITNVTTIGGKTNVFICKECNYGTDVYDNAIRHCQNHYNLVDDQVTYCGICQINYDADCFERHQSSHDRYLGNIKIKFSYHWLYTNWQVVFQKNNIALSDAEDAQVKSIYKTFCVRMSVREDGPWQSAVYLCIKCNTCVPSSDVEKHVQRTCTVGNKPCGKCDRVFLTYELLKHHEIYHTDDASEIFKTIVFNDQNDESFNSKLRQVKAQSRENPRIADIFKCLCGLCFISLKIFKLHFAYCDTELDDGSQCPMCSRLFPTTELEEHLLLHHSSLNYEFRVQKISFQLESIIDDSERETPLGSSNRTYNATQMTSNDEDLNIKTDMLKVESLTQSAVEENSRENVYNNDEEDIKPDEINEPVPKTSDSVTENTSQMRSNDVDLIIKRDMLKAESLTQTTDEENIQENVDTEEAIINRAKINEAVPGTSGSTTDKGAEITLNAIDLNINGDIDRLKQRTSGGNGRENIENVEMEGANTGLINETGQQNNCEDLIIKKDMLKDETLTQNIKPDEINEPVPKTSDSITENTSQMGSNDVDLIIKRDMLKAESLTQTTDEENIQENVDTEEAIINRAKINEAVPGTSGSTTDKGAEITLNEIDLNINGDIERLKQRTSGGNGRENIENVEMEGVNRGLINETRQQNNYEDLIIKKDMLKDETLTQNTNEENSQEILDTGEKEDIMREGNSQEIWAIEEPENPVDTEASEEVMVVEQSVNPINIEDSQEVNEAFGGPITIDGSQEKEVEESTHPITIEDSDDEIEFISGSFPDTTKILPLSYYFKR